VCVRGWVRVCVCVRVECVCVKCVCVYVEKKYPTDELISSLVEAANNDLDVKVILNVDEESAEQSAGVNQKVGLYLTKNGVDVKYDRPEIALHSKLLIVDGEHVVLGSHNWTAGSFWGYDDTSVYVASPDLAAGYEARFEQFWDDLEN